MSPRHTLPPMSKTRPPHVQLQGTYFDGVKAFIDASVKNPSRVREDIWAGGGSIATSSKTATIGLTLETNPSHSRRKLGPRNKPRTFCRSVSLISLTGTAQWRGSTPTGSQHASRIAAGSPRRRGAHATLSRPHWGRLSRPLRSLPTRRGALDATASLRASFNCPVVALQNSSEPQALSTLLRLSRLPHRKTHSFILSARRTKT